MPFWITSDGRLVDMKDIISGKHNEPRDQIYFLKLEYLLDYWNSIRASSHHFSRSASRRSSFSQSSFIRKKKIF